jgi:hypothetical protein
MPQTLERDKGDNGDPRKVQFGTILEKIRRGGSRALSEQERVAVVEIFRASAITNDKRVTKLRDEISTAHLEYCFRLRPHTPQKD